MKLLFLLPGILHALRVASAPAPAPAPYIVTSYVEFSIRTISPVTRVSTTRPESLYTYTKEIIPTVTPISPITTVTQASLYAHVTIIDVVLAANQGTTRDIYAVDTATTTTPSTRFVVPITYRPAASCTGSQTWTFVTNVPVSVPRVVQSQLVPVTVQTTATTYTYYDYSPTIYTSIIGVLNPSDVDASDLAYASSDYKPYALSYCGTPTTYCTTPAAETAASCTTGWDYSSSYYTGYTGSGSSGSGGSSSSFYTDDNTWIRNIILLAVFIPLGWALIWLVLGLIESWISFKGLMLGLQRKRGLPYAWCCISWIFLCFVGPTYKAKSADEQAVLKERWDAMGFGEKFKLWLKWGFRWKYPEVLGEEPEVAKRAFRQGCL